MKETAAIFTSFSSIEQLANHISEKDAFSSMPAQISFGPRKLGKSSIYQLQQMRRCGHVQNGDS